MTIMWDFSTYFSVVTLKKLDTRCLGGENWIIIDRERSSPYYDSSSKAWVVRAAEYPIQTDRDCSVAIASRTRVACIGVPSSSHLDILFSFPSCLICLRF